MAILGQNLIDLVGLQSSIIVELRAKSQNDQNTILMNWVENFSEFLLEIDLKNQFLAPKRQEITKTSKIFESIWNIFFVWNRSIMDRNVFQN